MGINLLCACNHSTTIYDEYEWRAKIYKTFVHDALCLNLKVVKCRHLLQLYEKAAALPGSALGNVLPRPDVIEHLDAKGVYAFLLCTCYTPPPHTHTHTDYLLKCSAVIP